MGGAIHKKSGRYISKFIFLSFCGSIQNLNKETLRSILTASGLWYFFFGEWFFSKQEVTFEYSRCQLLTQAVQNHLKYFLQLQLHSTHDVGTQNPENTPQTWNFSPLFLGKTCVMPHVWTLKKENSSHSLNSKGCELDYGCTRAFNKANRASLEVNESSARTSKKVEEGFSQRSPLVAFKTFFKKTNWQNLHAVRIDLLSSFNIFSYDSQILRNERF